MTFYNNGAVAILDSKNDMKFILSIPKTPSTVSFRKMVRRRFIIPYIKFVAYQITTNYFV